MTEVQDALKLLFLSKESDYRIAANTGITAATIGNYRNGKTKPTKANAMVLVKYFTNTQTEEECQGAVNNIETEHIKKSDKSIPLIPLDAMAGFGSGEMQIMEYECERYVVPMFRDADYLIAVKGSSMQPKYNSGDLVACRIVPLGTFFQWNKVYVLDTEQGALIKRVKRGSNDSHITLVSDNKKYEPFELHLSKINALAVVVGVLRLE